MSRAPVLALAVLAASAIGAAADDARGDARGDTAADAPAAIAGRAAVNEACASCHADIAAEWSGSLHRSAYRDVSFQRGYAVEPRAFCRTCHAPEADAAKGEPDAWAADHGVACTTCHGGTIEAAHGDAERSRGRAELGTRVCAGCHEFAFPDHEDAIKAPATAPRARMMQRTATEHAEGPHASASCASCHLPKVGEGSARHASHRFGVTRDPEVLRAAVSASARRDGNALVVDVAPRGVGHAFPTGDMFRRLSVLVEAGPDDAAPFARFERRLARTFGMMAGKKVEVSDTRLTGPTSLVFPLPRAAEGQPIRYRVVYQRLTTVPFGTRGGERLEQETVLAEGRVR